MAERLRLYTPVKPFHINQAFGSNPEYYARFHDSLGNPEKGHMGMDLMAFHGQPVYAAFDGVAHFEKDAHGGEGIYILSDKVYSYEAGQCYFNVINWHMIGDTDPKYPSPIPTTGVSVMVKTGDLIGYADNTGAPFESTGDHLHFGLQPCNQYGNPTNPGNGFGGCIDPAPFLTGFAAADYTLAVELYTQAVNLASALVAQLKQRTA